MRILRLYSLMAAAVVLAVGPAQGTTYSSLSSWQAAVNSGSVQTVDFSSFTSYTLITTSITGGSSPNTAIFSAGVPGDSQFYVYDQSTGQSPTGLGNFLLTNQDGPTLTHSFHVTLGQNTHTGFGANLWTNATTSQAIAITITFADNTTTTFNATTDNNRNSPVAFTGYTGTQAIASIDFSFTIPSFNSKQLGLDNFTWGDTLSSDPPPPVDTVEATTIAYVGMGILALYAGRRRRPQLAQ